MLRLERHELGPRVYVLRRRIHEYQLGVVIAGLLCAGAALGKVRVDESSMLAGVAAAWLIAKDWRDLFPSKRDTAAWRLGLHRRPAPLRALRRSDFLPPLAALAAFAAGLADLISTVTPNTGWRERLLAGFVSMEEMRLFHALALPAAAALMVAAFYLYRRRRGALHAAIALLVSLAALNLVKGLDLEEAVWSLAAAGLLWWGRDAFHVRHDPVSLRSALWRAPAVAVGTAILVVASVGVAAPAGTGAGTILRTAGDLVLWQSAPLTFHDELGHLPLAISLVVVLALLTIAYLIFRPLAAPRVLPDPHVRALAARLVRAHGTDTLAYFNLRRDKHYLFSADRKAFLGYRVENGVMVVSGDPVGSPTSVGAVVAEGVRFAQRHGLKLAAVGVGRPSLGLWERAGLRAMYIGDEAIVETRGFSLEGRAIRKVRQSVNRLESAGYTLELREVTELGPHMIEELDEVSTRWRRGAAERGFAMAMDSLAGDQSGSVVVIARDSGGAARGFLHLVPTYGRRAMSLSFMRRDPETPNGLMEFLVARAIELLRERGVDEVSLNFAAFARVLHSPRGRLERLAGRVIALGNPFFQIESLYRFNAKFYPCWEPRHLVYEGAFGLPRTALAVMWIEGQLPRPRLPWRAAVPTPR
jgi:lysyl-tRNA synthetase, class II